MKCILLLTFLFSLCGCASGRLNYTSPDIKNLESSSIELTGVFDSIWKKIVGRLSEKAYVINNIDKESGLINFSFTISPPSKYADCGRYLGDFSNLRGKVKYDFNGSESSNFSTTRGTEVNHIQRTTSLSGRGNLFLSQINAKTVSLRFTASYTLNGTDRHTFLGSNYNTITAINSFTVPFSTTEKGKNPKGFMECISTGRFESEIVKFLTM